MRDIFCALSLQLVSFTITEKSYRLADAELVWLQSQISFPRTVIDKITPHPNRSVEQVLCADGFSDIAAIQMQKGTLCQRRTAAVAGH